MGFIIKAIKDKISQKGIAGRAEAERSKFKDKTKFTWSKNYIYNTLLFTKITWYL